jgi:hypothetical protein
MIPLLIHLEVVEEKVLQGEIILEITVEMVEMVLPQEMRTTMVLPEVVVVEVQAT